MEANPLRAATFGVADLPAATARYEDLLDYRVVEHGTVPRDLAASFAAPQTAGRAFALLRPASGRAVDLRLIDLPPPAGYRRLRTYGWAALELCVQDVHAVHARMRQGSFEIIGPPTPIAGLPTIHPMQVAGPDGDVLFMTEIKQGGPGSGLPTAHTLIDTLFIAVLACRNLAQAAQWVTEQLGDTATPPIAIPYGTLTRAFGLPDTSRHEIATVARNGHIYLELDCYPPSAELRPCEPGLLPPGVAVVTLLQPKLDSVPGPWLTQPVRREGSLYEGRRAGVLRMPEGALVELVEADR